MEIHETDLRLSRPMGNFPAQNSLLRSSSSPRVAGASFPRFTGAQGVRADVATLHS